MKLYENLYVSQSERNFAVFQLGKKDPLTVGMSFQEASSLKSRLEKIEKFR